MAECSVVYGEFAQTADQITDVSAENMEIIRSRSDAFEVAAVQQAAREGHVAARQHIDEEIARLEKKWDGRFLNILKMMGSYEWMDYCEAFGRDRNILDARGHPKT